MNTETQEDRSTAERQVVGHPSAASAAALPTPRAVSLSSVLLCLLLLPVNAYWVVQMEMAHYSAHPTIFSFFFNVVFIVLVLTLINRQIERIARRFSLSMGSCCPPTPS